LFKGTVGLQKSAQTREVFFMSHSRLLTLGSSLCLLLAFGAVGCSENDPSSFAVTLSASNEVPPTTSSATGSATFVLNGDATVQYRVEVHSITSVTGAHILFGGPGATGPVRVTLFSGPTTGAMDGELAQGTFDASDVVRISFDTLLDEMRDGMAYVNVHTTDNPNGEIRGQVRLEQ
jgi:hypothetical protein